MENKEAKFMVAGFDMQIMRNRNEKRVLDCMRDEVDVDLLGLTAKDLQDIYACALNKLPARYAHSGTIVLRDPVKKEDIREAVRAATGRILDFPKR